MMILFLWVFGIVLMGYAGYYSVVACRVLVLHWCGAEMSRNDLVFFCHRFGIYLFGVTLWAIAIAAGLLIEVIGW